MLLLLLLLLLSRFSHVRLCATPETAAHQAPLSLGFSRQEHWSGVPLLVITSCYLYTTAIYQRLSMEKLMFSNCGAGEDS